MSVTENNNLKLSLRVQLLVGLIAGLWIYMFLILIGPFDIYPVKFSNRITMMSGYAIIFTLVYWTFIPIQNCLNRFSPKNYRIEYEIVSLIYVLLSMLFPTFAYYKSDFVSGEASFAVFLYSMYLPVMLLTLPILFIIRFLSSKYVRPEKRITIKGNGKYDLIQLNLSDLIFVKSSDNYVEIHYVERNRIKRKLIRTSLKNVKKAYPELLQTHRSYLINPQHFISWNGRNNVMLKEFEVPVSEKYRNQVLKLNSN